MKDNYKELRQNSSDAEIKDWIAQVTRTRRFDLEDYDEQVRSNPVIYSQPSSSSDVVGTEKLGDIAVGTDSGTEYLYVFVDDGGTLQWQRVALSTF